MTYRILHDHNYWTHGLEGLLNCDGVSMVRSAKSSLKACPLLDSKSSDNLVLAGPCDDTVFPNARIVFRNVHSPGFGTASHGECHEWCARSTQAFRYVLPDCVHRMYQASEKRQLLEFLARPSVCTSKFDAKLNQIHNAPRMAKRKADRIAVLFNWRFMTSHEDALATTDVVSRLNHIGKVVIVLHPFTRATCGDLEYFDSIIGKLAQQCEVRENLNTQQLLNLYDEATSIVSDGSGSLYEAIVRGCQPVIFDNFDYVRHGIYATAHKLEYLIGTPLADFLSDKVPVSASDQVEEFMDRNFGASLVNEDVTKYIHEELAELFDKDW